jgi:hypothetical protein
MLAFLVQVRLRPESKTVKGPLDVSDAYEVPVNPMQANKATIVVFLNPIIFYFPLLKVTRIKKPLLS